jgi:uncharacterized protein
MLYRVPGVYLEEIFLQPEVSLPTGIPGFIGFADTRAIAEAALQELPQGIHFPDSLKDKVDYDLDKKSLIFKGVMSIQAKNLLLALSLDLQFKKAVEDLWQKAQAVVALHHQEEFTDKYTTPDGYLTETVIGFFENGGILCYVVRADPDKDRKTALKSAFEFLANLDDIDLVAVPDAMTLLEPDDIYDVQNAVIKYCEEHGDRLAILDGCHDSKSVQEQREKIAGNQTGANTALYYPWLQVRSPNDGSLKPVPSCGHIAGIFSRSDRARGVFKAPANEEIRGAIGLEASISDTEQAELNTQGINCLRAFPGRGIRVWGARTLSSDRNWRYINIRRLFLTIKRWIDLNMAWAAFEPNSPQLWVRIQRELSVYLTQLWQAGGLKGETPEQAFYIRCDAETNPVENREIGQVMTEIGLAPAAPAEFIVVQLTHRADTTEMT